MRPVRRLVNAWMLLAFVLLVAEARAQNGATPRTSWGDPDLQATWNYWTFTPLERGDEAANRGVLTAEEATQLAEKQRQRAVTNTRPRAGDTGAYDQEVWTDRAQAKALTQTSLIVDPPSGKIPPLTREAQQAQEAQKAGGSHPVRIRTGGVGIDGPEDRGLAERCLLGFSTGPPMLPGGYNNNVQIFQSPGYVVLHLEMNHDARIVPVDGRPHLPDKMRQWMGDSRGRWEGNTLVVTTKNFTPKTASIALTGFAIGSAERLTLTERFTRTDRDTLLYEFTIDDPATFTRSFTGRFPMSLTNEPVFEYACHEGNYGMTNMLTGARALEREPAGRK